MNTRLHPVPRFRQRGIISLVVVIILIAAVMFVLNQTYGIIGTTSLSNDSQSDSIAAFFLAESGLERGGGIIKAATDPTAKSACATNITGTTPLGRGSFTLSATSAGCDGSNLNCTSCTITSTGKVGAASRILQRTFSLTAGSGGVTCNHLTTDCSNQSANPPAVPPTWSLTTKNTSANPAIAFLHLAATRQGNNSGASCTAQSNCSLKWNINSQNGARSVLSMGNLYTLDSGATLDAVYQRVASNRPEDVVEAAVLFPGTSTPTVIGAYWNDTNSGSGGTHGKNNDASGTTNYGTDVTSVACTNPAPGTAQQCTNWCTGGDTLIFGFSGGSTSGLSDTLASVSFNTAGTLAQKVSLTKLVHFPTASNVGAPANVYTEIWYAQNPNLSPAANALHVSSYKGNGSGTIGATWTGTGTGTGAGNSIVGTTLTVATINYPVNIISVGDTIASSGGSGNITGTPTIVTQLTSTESGNALGGRGTYQLSSSNQNVSDNANRTWTSASTVLNVSACTVCFFAPGDAVSGNESISGRTISAQQTPLRPGETIGGIGRYLLSGTQTTVAAASSVKAGTPGTTLYLPATSSIPIVSTPAMRIALVAGTGTGALDATTATTVTAVSAVDVPNPQTRSFTVSIIPTTPLDDATICGGTCAFFNQSSATTDFSIGKPANTDYWASGFACLSGANLPALVATGSSVQPTAWHEVVY